MMKAFWGLTLCLHAWCCFGYAQDIPDLYWDYKLQGDHQFKNKEYFYAFEHYRKAVDLFNGDPEIHYRMGRVYGLLEPQERFSDKEFGVALNLYLQNYVDMSKINRETMREFMGIPIDPYEHDHPSQQNPVVFMKRDIDQDGDNEAFLLLRRGNLSYALFVVDYMDYKPRVHHLVTFYEGESGKADLQFKDLNRDGREEIIVVSEMRDFLNIFIFTKTKGGTYREVLKHAGAFLGTHMFVDVKGDATKEVEVYEQLRDGIVFDPNQGPYLMKKSIYMWTGERYRVVHSEPVYNEGYALNEFFGSLLQDNDFERAFRHIRPEIFLSRLGSGADLESFKAYMRQPDYQIFLAETPNTQDVLSQLKLRRDLRFDMGQAWEEGGNAAAKSSLVRDDEKRYRLTLGRDTYLLVLMYHGRWYVEQLVKESLPDGGWE